jgi:antitoxin CptB
MKELERARWRCRRGLLELDIVLLRFMDKYYTQLNEAELQQFEELLSLSDNELWNLIVGMKKIKNVEAQYVLRLLQLS